ncbi:hypothetical protein BC628DRAFT_128402 [Trametes gibbosa]|nr:hypothetical protein BC628DRAFT_128402 [Trametes gibbosa]
MREAASRQVQLQAEARGRRHRSSVQKRSSIITVTLCDSLGAPYSKPWIWCTLTTEIRRGPSAAVAYSHCTCNGCLDTYRVPLDRACVRQELQGPAQILGMMHSRTVKTSVPCMYLYPGHGAPDGAKEVVKIWALREDRRLYASLSHRWRCLSPSRVG